MDKKDMDKKDKPETHIPLLQRSKWDISLSSIANDYDMHVSGVPRTTPFKKRSALNTGSTKTKYQHMKEIKNIKGFVVHVHAPTDFDIHLELPDDKINEYNNVIKHKYTYKDVNDNFIQCNPLSHSGEREGIVYRCRLHGIGINKTQQQQNSYRWKCNQYLLQILQLLDRTDRWVTCDLLDIDVYQRLLVNITLNMSDGPINITDYLLDKMETEEGPIFQKYSKI
jgi:hypothetical protein